MSDLTIVFSMSYAAWMGASEKAKLLKIGTGQWYLGLDWVGEPKGRWSISGCQLFGVPSQRSLHHIPTECWVQPHEWGWK